MKHVSYIGLTVSILAALALGGCADPADETPDAEVTEITTPVVPVEPAATEGTIYTFTPDTTVAFTGSKVTGSHEGGFGQLAGSISVPGDDLTRAAIEATIDMTSVFTDADKLTSHLMSADFFEVETYPESKFTSTSIAQNGDNYTITGDFTLHGVTKSISFPATITLEEDRVLADAKFDINRFDFGIKYPGNADDLIREKVVITLDIEATK